MEDNACNDFIEIIGESDEFEVFWFDIVMRERGLFQPIEKT